MADTRMYKVAITPCGKYVHGTEYDILSEVLNATEDGGDGCSYISIKRNRNVKPGTDPTVWAISTQRGEPGEKGSGFSYAVVSVDSTSGTPSATCRIENDTFYVDFFGLKGADGTPGVQGPPGQDGQPGADGVGFNSASNPTPPDGTATFTLSNGDTITLDFNHEHSDYCKLIADSVIPSSGFLPDVVYKLGTLTGNIVFDLAPAVAGNTNHYFWTFTAGETAPNVTWPSGITWFDGSGPTVESGHYYEISIMNGMAVYMEI